jgi:uroporphyrinogen-III synthase
MKARALAGRKVLVTRALEDAERWASRLTLLGAVPVVFPCLILEMIDNQEIRQSLHDALREARWLVLTSTRGAVAAGVLLGGELPAHVRVAVVGPTTARAAIGSVGRVDLMAKTASSGGLGAELADVVRDDSGMGALGVVVAGAVGGRDEAEIALRAAGVAVTRLDLYRTTPIPRATKKRQLGAEGIQDVLLASPSAVRGLMNAAVVPVDARVIAIGPTTSAAARAAGLAVTAEARRPSLEGMIEVMS